MTETETDPGLLLSPWLPDLFVVTEYLNEKGHMCHDRGQGTHIFLPGMATVVTVIEIGIAVVTMREVDVVGCATVKENVVQEGGTQRTVTVVHKTEALPEGMNHPTFTSTLLIMTLRPFSPRRGACFTL